MSDTPVAISSEAEIQQEVERLIFHTELLDRIENLEEPEEVLEILQSANYISNFPVDYLIRKRTATAAQRMISIISSLELVSNNRKSISLTTGEILYPDVLAVNNYDAAVATFELKRGSQTEREAVTELMAFEHEIRNHLPFLSNRDTGLVVVATEFDTLLDHSIASLVTWERRNILCLRAIKRQDGMTFQIHLPSCWAPINQKSLPTGAIRIGHLKVVPKDKEYDAEEIEQFCFQALDFAAKECERNGLHGFSLFCKDYFVDQTKSAFFLIVGLIDPFVFLKGLSGRELDLLRKDSPLAAFIRKASSFNLSESIQSFRWFEMQMYRVLDGCDVRLEWDGFSTWDKERSPTNRFNGCFNLQQRGIPLYLDSWGNIGEYIQEMALHPDMRTKFLPYQKVPSWNDPAIALPILDWTATTPIFPNGQLTARGFFHLGLRVGRFRSTYLACLTVDDGDFKDIPHKLFWLQNDFIEASREITTRFLSTDDLDEIAILRSYRPEEADKSIECLDEYVKWLVADFITDNHPIHQQSFELGMNAQVLFDDWCQMALEERQKLDSVLTEVSKIHLKELVDYAQLQDDGDPDKQELLKVCLIEDYGINVNDDEEQQAQQLEAVSSSIHVKNLEPVLLPMVDQIYLPVFHVLTPLKLEGKVDWDWLQSEVEKKKKAGRVAGVYIGSDGSVGTACFDSLPILPHTDDLENKVLVCQDKVAGIYRHYSWEELKEGALDD